jgi:hypothetical protein
MFTKNSKIKLKHNLEDSVNNVFDVEKILDKKYENGRLLYLVKWLDYPNSENTWEPLTHLTDVRELIEEFEKEQLEKEKGGFVDKNFEFDDRPFKFKYISNKPPTGNIKTDIPKKFKSAKKAEENVYILVEWNERMDGIQPLDSYIVNKVLREKYGNMLLDFYEDRLKFNNKFN